MNRVLDSIAGTGRVCYETGPGTLVLDGAASDGESRRVTDLRMIANLHIACLRDADYPAEQDADRSRAHGLASSLGRDANRGWFR